MDLVLRIWHIEEHDATILENCDVLMSGLVDFKGDTFLFLTRFLLSSVHICMHMNQVYSLSYIISFYGNWGGSAT